MNYRQGGIEQVPLQRCKESWSRQQLSEGEPVFASAVPPSVSDKRKTQLKV